MNDTTTDLKVQPSDFADPDAFDLGPYRSLGTLNNAYTHVRNVLVGLSGGFDITKVQFYFNGTPVVMSLDDSPEDLHTDWHQRRTAYQSAAGII